ncbi:MAG: DNA replication/repair protein RecF [Firmicutes bacterium]|nr:DNA replication/repair protein RecF [Bacillota bacterium]
MRVDRIELKNFRNYENAAAGFSPGINVIAGENAQGKTNLLEAVFLLSGGKSFRTRFDSELIGFDRETAELLADVETQGRKQSISVHLKRGQKKSITRNGVKTAAPELSEVLCAVLFCPDDLELIKAGAAARRRLLDLSISQLRPGYAVALAEYNRLYAHKLRILKDCAAKGSLRETLGDFSEAMCRAGAKLIRYRASFIARLGPHAREIARDFSGGAERLDVAYRTVSAVTDPLGSPHVILEQLRAHMAAHREAELCASSCLSGPHKDDLEIKINGVPARAFASQGQTRTAALSLKLAEREIFLEECGEYPILLLDDVLSELDQRRQAFVLNRIGGGQTLITCCEDDGVADRTGGKILTVKGGAIA